MKKHLIKILLLVIILPATLFSSTYKWSSYADKNEVYTNEAIYLKYVCEFSDRAELFSIDFNPVTKNEIYTLELLSETTKIKNYKKIITYEFIAFVHKAGVREFEFEMTMQETNQDSIENTVIGRDNGKYEEYTQRYMKQNKLLVNVKDAKTPIVGSLSMQVKEEQESVKALTPYNLEIKIEGSTNFEAIKAVKFDIEGVKIFSSEPHKSIKLTQSGYVGTWTQKFAFVGEKEFKIPFFTFEYFDLQKQAIKELSFKGSTVNVIAGYKREELLDEEEEDFIFDYTYLYYFLFFVAGFLVSKIKFKRVKKVSSQDELFIQKIETCKNVDAILFVLALENSSKYKDLISKIETKELNSLSEIKKLI